MRITESDFLWYWKNRMSSNSWRIADRSENFQNNPLYYPRGDQWLIRYYVFEDNARFNGWCGPISHLINSPNWESMFEIREKKALFFFTCRGSRFIFYALIPVVFSCSALRLRTPTRGAPTAFPSLCLWIPE